MINTSQCDPDDVPICVNCIGDDFLRDEIRTSGCTASCSVCGAEAISWGSRQYAQRIFQFSNLALHLQASDFFWQFLKI
ncbi:hypothetical protein [Burkholderia sp. RS02]|uniref:hypothetical protein n=1 Tax=unclassified Burkholderia TaxID=2613784 RepID=UPI0032189791